MKTKRIKKYHIRKELKTIILIGIMLLINFNIYNVVWLNVPSWMNLNCKIIGWLLLPINYIITVLKIESLRG